MAANGGYGEVTNGELARRMDDIKTAFSDLHEELALSHQRLRHDVANLQAQHGGIGARVDANIKRLDRVETMVDKIVWAVIGAYGAVVLTVLGIVITKNI